MLAFMADVCDGTGSPKDGVVKRRGKTFQGSGRKLTVDTKHRLIGDFVDKVSKHTETPDATCISKKHPAQATQTPGIMLSVWGSATTDDDKFAPYFAQKGMHFDGELNRIQHRIGLKCHRGHKPESPNQDDFFVLARPEWLLLGVLDGHGPDGHDVSHFAQERLPMYMMERLRHDGDAWEEAVCGSVQELCSRAREELPNKTDYSGSTVTVAMLDQVPATAVDDNAAKTLRLRCAFLGDSIAVLAKRKSKRDPWEVTQLTDIHRPDRQDEAKRIEAAGGRVQPAGEHDACSRLLTPEWNLAISRSFGDFHALPYGLSSEPQLAPTMELDSGHEHLVLICSDGVWDVMSPAQAVAFVGKFPPEDAQVAAERLVAKATLRWQETEDVVDDITAIVVWPGLGIDEDVEKPSR